MEVDGSGRTNARRWLRNDATMSRKRRREKRRKRKKNKRRETDKRRGRINSKVGEGTFSDEIRSRGRSEFGYLIHEGGKNRVAESKGKRNGGDEDVQVRVSSLSLSLSLYSHISTYGRNIQTA